MTYRRRGNPGAGSALVMLASQGLGGGIEALADGVIEALRTIGVEVEVLALLSAERPVMSLWGKVCFSVHALWRAWRTHPGRVVAMHPSLSFITVLADIMSRGRGPRPAVVFYDLADICRTPWWRLVPVRWRGLQILTISSFSAGALAGAGAGRARILPPVLGAARYAAFAGVRRVRTGEDLRAPQVLTVCRLEQTEGKGILVLIEAIERLVSTHPSVTLVVAGRGPAPSQLVDLADSRPWVRLVESPSTLELSEIYRKASIFVLATRTQCSPGTYPTGEGFGLVLAEAQLAGVPVVAPASGGSADAFIDGITGVRPTDESVPALTAAIVALLDDPIAYARMSANAAVWSAHAFCPEQALRAVSAALLGEPAPTRHTLHLTGDPGHQGDDLALTGPPRRSFRSSELTNLDHGSRDQSSKRSADL